MPAILAKRYSTGLDFELQAIGVFVAKRGIFEGVVKMNIKLIGSALVAGLLLSVGSIAPANAQAQRNYDCSKPGNANKTVCKTAVKSAPAPRATPVATRNYDCTKPGNANKTACKAAAKPAPHAATAVARNYDCSKPGNANKSVCKTAMAPAPAAHPTSARAPRAITSAAGPQGATAKCRDNTYSHAATHSGACSHHGGVATWY